MRNIEQLAKTVEIYKNIIVQKSFKSKKNSVGYVTIDGKPRVLKWFYPGFKHQMENEYKILKKAKSELKIPFPYDIDTDNNVLITSYIMGENLCDIINDDKCRISEKERLMMLLAKWYAKFHNHFRFDDEFIIRGDSNLRNFIFTDQIWGVDFEESRVGKPVEDISRMCSSILTTDPMFTSEKFQLCKIFIKSYLENVKWNLDNINDEISYSLLEKIQWRPDDEEILRKYSNKIKKERLV